MNRRTMLQFSGAGVASVAAGTLIAPRLAGQTSQIEATLKQNTAILAGVYNSGEFTSESLRASQRALMEIALIMQITGQDEAIYGAVSGGKAPSITPAVLQTLLQGLAAYGVAMQPGYAQSLLSKADSTPGAVTTLAETGASASVLMMSNLLGGIANDIEAGKLSARHPTQRDPQAGTPGIALSPCTKGAIWLAACGVASNALLMSTLVGCVFCGSLGIALSLGTSIATAYYAYKCPV